MEAVDALNEIAFRMERDLAPGFKVKAFRNAAKVIGKLSADEVAERTGDGRLKNTKGIGDSTFAVIQQAVDGGVPSRLEELREHGPKPLTGKAADLHSQLRGDLHTHSEWSDGTTPIDLMVDAAKWLGHEYLALTDHSPNLKIANGLTAERLTEQLDVVSKINERQSDVRLLGGIEVDILEDGELDQSPELLERLDIVVASVHSKLRADRSTMTRRMLGALNDPRTNILGHCTGRLVKGSRGTRPQSEFDAKKIFATCAANNVAVEINSRPERQDPPDDLIKLALDAGCLFSIDSDAHAPGHLGFLDLGAERAASNNVPVDRIINTWPLEKLLDWASSGR